MTLAAGAKLGPYEIQSPLGAGGMGEVYKARDSKLGRDVAIKVLPERFAQDADALARFEREARAVAALNHPNILGIYDFGTAGNVAYAVMELLEGESLRDRIDAGPIPVRKAIDWAQQIAIGLAAAHEREIVHRDLKPENLFLTRDGRVKILDFGLAKRVGKTTAEDATSAPTMSQQTDPGTVMGTVGYMSPEQVRGLAVDARSDLFAFGAILYEMLSGKRAFRRDTASDTMSAILRDEPEELAESGRKIPVVLDRIVRHCLEKNPAERFQSARDVAFGLQHAASESTSTTAAPARDRAPFRAKAVPFTIAVAAALTAGIIGDRLVRRPSAPPLVAIRPLTYSGEDHFPSVSPDGKTMAFSSNRDGTMRVWLKQLSTGDEVALTAGPDVLPRFSPDGSQILFVRGEYRTAPNGLATTADLYRVAVIGGQPKRIATAASAADWSPDGKTIVFARATANPLAASVWIMPADGGEAKEIAQWRDRFAGPPRFSPDGKSIAVPSFPALAGGGAVLEMLSPDGRKHSTLAVPGSLGTFSNVVWDPDEKFVYFVQQLNARFGASRLLREDVRSAVLTPLVWLPFEVNGVEAIGSGRIVADSAAARQNLAEIDLENPSAPPRWLARGTSTDRQPVYSPDGQWIAFCSNRSGNLDIWEISTKTGALRRMTDDAADDWDPGFTRDGKLIWSSGRTGRLEIWVAEADGSSPRAVTHRQTDCENPTGTPDGSIVFAVTNDPAIGMWKIRPDGSGGERLGGAGSCINVPETSPDGKYAACPDLGVGPLRAVRLSDGGALPFTIDVPHSRITETQMGRVRWSPEGRKVYFIGQDENGINGIYSQDFDPERKDTSVSRKKVAAFDPNFEAESFGVSPDGRHLVVAFLERTYGIVTIEGVPGVEKDAR